MYVRPSVGELLRAGRLEERARSRVGRTAIGCQRAGLVRFHRETVRVCEYLAMQHLPPGGQSRRVYYVHGRAYVYVLDMYSNNGHCQSNCRAAHRTIAGGMQRKKRQSDWAIQFWLPTGGRMDAKALFRTVEQVNPMTHLGHDCRIEGCEWLKCQRWLVLCT